jgi:hypothetical protein
MNWGPHAKVVDRRLDLLNWTLRYAVRPYQNLPLDYGFQHLFLPSLGYGGDPGWEIDIVFASDGNTYYDVSDPEGYVEEPLTTIRYSEAEFRSALRKTLEQVTLQYPERAREVRDVIRKWSL